MPIPIHTIITHRRPHLDEGVAIWLLQTFGETHFPGVKNAKIFYVDAGTETHDGKKADELEAEGVLMLGIGTGRFNEHATSEDDRKTLECTATLVAKALRVNEHRELSEILNYVLQNDTRGAAHKFELGSVMTVMHGQGISPGAVLTWLKVALDAKYREQWRFWHEAAAEYERVVRRERLRLPGSNNEVTIAVIETDNELIPKYARAIAGESVVVVRSSSGHTQVLKQRRLGLPMADVAAAIRLAEAEARGKPINREELNREGSVLGAECWHFQEETGAILNGSLTARNVEPTRLGLAEISLIIANTLREGWTSHSNSRRMSFSLEDITAATPL